MARIFIAIRFNHAFKQALVGVQNALKDKGVKGNYCAYGNLHLTLAFIGERYNLPEICKAVSEVAFRPFTLTLSTLGTFPTKAGVIWCGVEACQAVTMLAHQLRQRLSAHDIQYSTLAFFPHISLVQHPKPVVTDVEVEKMSIMVDKIYVMKSERVAGELVYSEITRCSALSLA